MTINVSYPQASTETIAFSAQELSFYLGKMYGDTIIITNNQTEGLGRINLHLKSLGGQKNTKDQYCINITPEGGAITGSNDRSVLLGVYYYLHLLGCRFLAPGKKHELIPPLYKKEQLACHCEKEATFRHRGVCIEGANSLENILDFIDWLPKLGFNSFFLQFKVPYTFLARWYHHEMNPLLPPEAFTEEDAKACAATVEKALLKRGLLLHQAGHGWTGEVLGYPCTDWKPADKPLSPESQPLAALLNGERKLFHQVPMNTNLCYSNETVIEKFSDCVVEYCKSHPAVSYIHVWLADEFNNICECEACQAQLPSDQYINLLNRIDEKLSLQQLSARIVFLLYQELLWPPMKRAFHNPDRFVLMFAPISRTFERSYELEGLKSTVPAYERNHITLPVNLKENLAFLRAWQRYFTGESFVYDYPLGRAHYGDFGYVHMAEIISQDIRKLRQLGMDGYISCQELRVCFPNALPNYIMGRMLFDSSCTLKKVEEEYFQAAYGGGWEAVLSYLTSLSSLSGCDYFNGKGPRADSSEEESMEKLLYTVQNFEFQEAGNDSRPPAQNLFWKYLDYHREYSLRLGKALLKLSKGENQEAQSCFGDFQRMVCEKESSFQECFDVYRITEVSCKYTGFRLEEHLAKTL